MSLHLNAIGQCSKKSDLHLISQPGITRDSRCGGGCVFWNGGRPWLFSIQTPGETHMALTGATDEIENQGKTQPSAFADSLVSSRCAICSIFLGPRPDRLDELRRILLFSTLWTY